MWTGILYNFSFRRCDTFIEHHRTTSSRVVKTAKRRQPSLPARAFVCELPWHHHKRWRCKKSALGFCFPDRTNICKQCKKTGPYISLIAFLYNSLILFVHVFVHVFYCLISLPGGSIRCPIRCFSHPAHRVRPSNTERFGDAGTAAKHSTADSTTNDQWWPTYKRRC